MTAIALNAADELRVEEFAGNLFMACLGALELANVELGVRLHLYDALLDGPLTGRELSTKAGIAERYAQEWLEQQTVAGVLDVDDTSKSAADRRFALPTAHAHVLLDDDSDACMKPCAAVVPWLATAVDIMENEFRSGRGASFGAFDLHDIQAAFTRPVFVNHLTQDWLPALPDIVAKLNAGEQVRIAEVGCGEGLAAVTIASAYPNVEVDGYDLDEASISAARKEAADAGVGERVRFHLKDAAAPDIVGDYDLVMAIEMVHDVPDPVGILRTMKKLAGARGAVLVADERTEDSFTVPTTEMERLFYGFSTLHCLSVSMQGGGAGTGTVIRPGVLEQYAADAGFNRVETLDVEHPQFRLYRLR
jgi:2-polyprenyl-3-methyl-5-hydroxy-6-metoxy-1,4-benzoquinol methylase